MNEVVVPSPAKVNLFLEIIGRRPDGYHDIASIMQLVDLCDEVRLRRRRTGIRVEVQGAELPAGRAGAIIKNEEKCIRCALCAQRCQIGRAHV